MYADAMEKGVVFNVQKYSVHDGPGIRTIVFLKGCPLRCRWCSNPESQRNAPDIAWNDTSCIGCLSCVHTCPQKALSLSPRGILKDHERCVGCLSCVRACPAEAMFLYGGERRVKDILDDVEKDSLFYARSGGGITLSGGEPLFQPQFALALLREAKERHIHRAMESCAFCPEETFLEAAGLLNYLLVDVKCPDEERHRLFTGQSNKRILSNIRAAHQAFPALPIHVRTPVIPGVNDTEEDIAAIASFAREAGAQAYELLPYHKMGESKYRFLGKDYPMGDAALDEAKFKRLQALAAGIMPASPNLSD
ncbi:glycyl-radical enzyme activating protein [Mailhella massiliensis]|uniref:Glycyl-radical enzyme activating protein n=1 Tax=Mailhella massiliensis TaxID=1903261 RepID=A0A921AVM0_9BACT|nr:glycyl-radical enzyme activating protein [Mailhella massiliensis]HJD96637.1 glycyl-radical enzyme activating protein [Mailhella massiliensis]